MAMVGVSAKSNLLIINHNSSGALQNVVPHTEAVPEKNIGGGGARQKS